jgi:hypothetical protein
MTLTFDRSHIGIKKSHQQLLKHSSDMIAYCACSTFQEWMRDIRRWSGNADEDITWADVERWLDARGEDISKHVARYGSR